MTIHGADIEALESFGGGLDEARDTATAVLQRSIATIGDLEWHGPDAEALRPAWTDRLGALIALIDEALSDLASETRRQASEQREASGTA